MQTSLERIGALMQGKIPDRVPVICNLFEQGAKELGLSIKEYYSKPEYVAEGQIKLQEKYQYDCVWGFMFTGIIARILGSKGTIYSNDGPPNVGDMVLKKVEDISTFEIPDNIEDTKPMQDWIKCIQLITNEVGGKIPVLSGNVGTFSLPAILLGMEKWFELLLMGPFELRDELLAKCNIFNEKLVTSLRNAGVDMIAYMNPVGTKEFISFNQFNDLCLPWVKKDFQNIGVDGIIYFNGGGEINHTIDTLINETGIGAYYIHPFDDIKEAKSIINGRGISSGIINDIKLISWTPGETKSEVRRIMKEGSEGGGFIFGTLVMPYMIPDENIKIMMEAAFEYGAY